MAAFHEQPPMPRATLLDPESLQRNSRSQPAMGQTIRSFGGFGGGNNAAMLPPDKVTHMPYPYQKPKHRRTNICGIGISLFLPWLIFCVFFFLTGFGPHHEAQSVVHFLLVLSFLFFFILTIHTCHSTCRDYGSADYTPDWCCFIAITALLALVLGVICGNYQYWTNMEAFYDVASLSTYKDLDPTLIRGQEVMDAGQVLFADNAYLDLNLSMGFKNQDTFCVAPISATRPEPDGEDLRLASYDFWAVGINCCTSGTNDFKCGNYNNHHARQGLRVTVNDDQRSFFRLAVEQASSTYNIKSDHPLFFYWVVDSEAEAGKHRSNGFRSFTIGMFAYFVGQLLLVATMGLCVHNPQVFSRIASIYT